MTSRREDMTRALLWASVVIIVVMTFLPHYIWNDTSQIYGLLWWVFNFDFKNYVTYSYQLTIVQLLVMIPQFILVAKKKLSKEIVTLNLFTTALYRVVQVQQDVTVIMFQPLVTISPIFLVLFLLQKLPIGFDSNAVTGWSMQIHNNSPLNFGYISLAFWFVFPLVIWFKNRRQKK